MQKLDQMSDDLQLKENFFSYIDSAVTKKQYSLDRLSEIRHFDELNRTTQNLQLAGKLSANERVIYYISDLHIEDRIGRKFGYDLLRTRASKAEILAYFDEIIESLFRDDFGRKIQFANDSYLVFIGDTARRFAVAEYFQKRFKEFINHYDAGLLNGLKVVYVLGNHELGNQHYEGLILLIKSSKHTGIYVKKMVLFFCKTNYFLRTVE